MIGILERATRVANLDVRTPSHVLFTEEADHSMTSFNAALRATVRWETMGDEVLVLDQRADRVHRLSGHSALAATWALSNTGASIDDAPSDLQPLVAALIDSGIVPTGTIVDTRTQWSRRRLITLGAAGIGIVSLALPSAAAAASTEGGGGGSGNDPAPPPVGEISATASPTSLELSWAEQSDVDYFRVFYRPEVSGMNSAPFVDTSVNSVVLTGLVPLTSYAIWIVSFRGTRSSNPSTTIVRSTLAPPSPDSGTATSTPTSITFSWSAVSGASEYRVTFWPTGRTDLAAEVQPSPLSATSVTASGLTSGVQYSWYVQARLSGVWSTAPTSNNASLTNTRLAATTVALTPAATALTVEWAAVSNATSYQVFYKPTSAAEFTSWGATGSTSTTITALTPSTSYDVYVVASNSFTTSPASATYSASTSVTPAPGQPTVSATTFSSITLTWPAVASASSYEVFHRTGSAAYASAGTTAGTTLTISSLLPDTAYDCYVTATISGVSSSGSTVRTATTATVTAPGAPSFSLVTATSFRASWTAVSGVTGYEVFVKRTADAAYTSAGTTVAPTVALDIGGLVPGTEYTVFVVATYAGASSANGTTASTITALPTAPDAPTVASTFESATVSWTAVAGADSYEVFTRTGANAFASAGTTTSTSLTVNDLLPNTAYDFQVRTVQSGVSSDASTTTSATTASLAAPTAGAVTLNCSWTAIVGATNYEVWARTGFDSFTKRSTDPLTATTFTITGLTVETAYDVSVIATTANGSETSNTRTATTLPIASGGTRADGGTHWIHTIAASENFVANLPVTVDYLLVGGGGGAGRGGGGGGGVVTGSGVSLAANTYAVVVGAGGLSGSSAATTSAQRNGGDTTFNGTTAGGGGGGGKTTAGAPGVATNGSGGGGGATAKNDALAGGTGNGSGNRGGATNTWSTGSGNGRGGGGGGAGGAGTNSSGSAASTTGGNGGLPLANSITGSSKTYAGGGRGGGTSNGTSGTGTAGYGDGGDGTGDGLGAAGRAGVVIIKYSKTPSSAIRPMVIRRS